MFISVNIASGDKMTNDIHRQGLGVFPASRDSEKPRHLVITSWLIIIKT